MGDIVLRIGKKNAGIRPGFILSISPDNRLYAWDEEGHPVHFIDYTRSADAGPWLALDRFCVAGSNEGASLIMLFAALSGYSVEFVTVSGTNIPHRSDVRGDLYRVIDPHRPSTRTGPTNGQRRPSPSTRPASR
jgi:hypothetical protein